MKLQTCCSLQLCEHQFVIHLWWSRPSCCGSDLGSRRYNQPTVLNMLSVERSTVTSHLCSLSAVSSTFSVRFMSVTSVIWLITEQRAFSLFLCTLLGEPIVIATLHRTQSCKSWGFTFAQGLMFYVLYSWIHSLHSWRINVDILRPRCFLCCASKDRKWSSWLLIGWGGKKSDGVIWETDTN